MWLKLILILYSQILATKLDRVITAWFIILYALVSYDHFWKKNRRYYLRNYAVKVPNFFQVNKSSPSLALSFDNYLYAWVFF